MRRRCQFGRHIKTLLTAVIIPFVLMAAGSQVAQAQRLTVLHTFTGAGDGGIPNAGLVRDRLGNLYGVASGGGQGYGTAFRMTHRGSTWTFNTLHTFSAGTDGAYPNGSVFVAPNGFVYGITSEGGGTGNCYYDGCGTVFRLRPSSPLCGAGCWWTYSVLYRFTGGNDGAFPDSGFLADSTGSLYGETLGGGTYGNGAVYKLENSGGTWVENVIYSFTGESDGIGPIGGLTLDSEGNLYGTTDSGGAGNFGTVYELSLSGSSWTETTLHAFSGGYSVSGLIFDSHGNLYGNTEYGGCCFSGVVFELSPSGGGWSYTVLYDFSGEYEGPAASLVMDSQGNLYGTTVGTGLYNRGTVFKLSPSGDGWTYADLHDFTGGSDGAAPAGTLILDSRGNLYGTASAGGLANGCNGYGCGVVFEITP